LICSGCPVRVECLRASLEPITLPGVVREAEGERQKIAAPERLRVMGTFGGATEYDRRTVSDLPIPERVQPDVSRVRRSAPSDAARCRLLLETVPGPGAQGTEAA
jgi:hypothetical protein